METWKSLYEYLHRLNNISKPSVYAWKPDATKRTEMMNGDNAANVCSWLRINSKWLFENEGPSGLESTPPTKTDSATVEPGPDIGGRVPVISWVQAGDYAEAIDNVHRREVEEWVATTVQVRRNTFALRVVGDSMEPDFPSGIIIVVEPELDPNPGDFVIARNGGGEATFKQLVRDGSDWYLKPINTRYPIKPLGSSQVVGVVREMVKKFR
jgi:SOS-response transcriptional repressor LexA